MEDDNKENLITAEDVYNRVNKEINELELQIEEYNEVDSIYQNNKKKLKKLYGKDIPDSL